MSITLENAAIVGGDFALVFSDGREIYLPLSMVRRACPCAVCQGEPDALGRVVRPRVELTAAAFDLRKFEMVGGYGLQLYWADGHSTGIYSYSYLLRLAEIGSN
jgi:DUF971 family protein